MQRIIFLLCLTIFPLDGFSLTLDGQSREKKQERARPQAYAQSERSGEIAIPLEGQWRFKVGINKEAFDLSYNDDDWAFLTVPQAWDVQAGFIGFNGLGLYRKVVTIPKEAKGKTLYCALGKIGGTDELYLNGQLVGRTGSVNELDYSTERVYYLPESLIRYGEPNVIAVRVFSNEFGGGIYRGIGPEKNRLGIFTKTALRRAAGEPSRRADSTKAKVIKGIVQLMDNALQTGNLQLYFDFLSDAYSNNGTQKEEQKLFVQGLAVSLTKYTIAYDDLEVYVVNDSLLVVDYDTVLLDKEGTKKEVQRGHDVRYFKLEEGTYREYGNQSRFFEVTLKSRFLKANVKTLIYLPPSYPTRQSWLYPVLYLLHPQGASPEVWLEAELGKMIDSLIAAKAISEMIVVMPSDAGSYFVTSRDSAVSFEQFLFEEVVDMVKEDYRSAIKRELHAISGISWGGTAAMSLALRSQKGRDYFGSVSSLMGQAQRRFQKRDIDGDSARFWDAYHIETVVRKTPASGLKGMPILLLSAQGDAYTEGIKKAHAALLARGAASRLKLQKGRADFEFWVSALPEVLKFHSERFVEASRKSALSKPTKK